MKLMMTHGDRPLNVSRRYGRAQTTQFFSEVYVSDVKCEMNETGASDTELFFVGGISQFIVGKVKV